MEAPALHGLRHAAHVHRRGARAHAAALLTLALGASGCAGTLTFAVGEHARAAIAQPATCAPTGTPAAPQVLGTRTTTVEAREGKLGPDNVTTTTTSEPALAPVPEQAPLHVAEGAKVSETAGGVLKTALGVLGGLARGLLAFFVPGP